MIKEDLNIDNVLKILEREKYNYQSLQYPYGMTISTYNTIIKTLLDNFFNYKINKLEIDDELYSFPNVGGKVYTIEDNIYIENSYRINFKSIYPYVLIKLWKKGKIKFNINEFGVLYSFLVNNYKNVKKLNINENIIVLWKTLINYTYANLLYIPTSSNVFIDCDYPHLVAEHTTNFFDKLIKKYSDIVLYIDTCTMFLDFITKDLLDDIKKFNIPFTVDKDLSFFIIKKKKIIVIENNKVTHRGFKEYKSNYELEKSRFIKLKKLKQYENNRYSYFK